jgi:hydrogenase maturation protein HypF
VNLQEATGRRIRVRGVVQGVGFRPWVYRLAREAGIAGRVRNDTAGVTIDAFGDGAALEAFLARLGGSPPPAASIRDLRWEPIPGEDCGGFVIVESGAAGPKEVSIPPDLAVCDECLAEIADPSDRRFGYPFTNCTNCGPRFTIAREVPYDRPATTMSAFPMCPDCEREYGDVSDRRFHAQPIACPACGPQVWLASPRGELGTFHEPLRAAAQAIQAGLIVAVKGLGGFHLACDATSDEAVRRLRWRKKRDEKPFAVMVRDLARARELAEVGREEERLLACVERPIVLVRRREPNALSEDVAPGNPLVGLLLPYTPLHELLLSATGRPLVMTSGNLSEEPIAYRNAEALERLGPIADLMLFHDREIESRCDDSVARLVAGQPTVFRRSRGYVPRPIGVERGFVRPVLACGAHLKNTFCLGVRDAAHLGPHVGDLENLETYASFEEAIARMERFLRVRPEVIAYDLHPEYLSTRYARERSEARKIGVQHHHAHVASAMAEHGLAGPVLGIAYDGTGYGTDGTAWGGEILRADFEGFERMATLRPILLPGGDRAIRQVWRIAASLLEDAFGDDAPYERIPLFAQAAAADLPVIRRMRSQNLASPPARGAGRYFDGIGALVLGRAASRYEGQVAMAWNFAADPAERGSYPYQIEGSREIPEIDFRPMVRAVVADLLAGRSAAAISGRFHNTLARSAAEALRDAARRSGRLPVILTGGCFQNSLLVEKLLELLGADFRVYRHREVPPGDGGIALGQALVADAVARRR